MLNLLCYPLKYRTIRKFNAFGNLLSLVHLSGPWTTFSKNREAFYVCSTVTSNDLVVNHFIISHFFFISLSSISAPQLRAKGQRLLFTRWPRFLQFFVIYFLVLTWHGINDDPFSGSDKYLASRQCICINIS